MPCFAAHQKTVFMVRTEILKALLIDPEWQERLLKLRTLREFEAIVMEYTRLKGWEVREVR
jgi:hypothetical protein